MRARALLLVLPVALALGATLHVDDDNCPGPGSGTVGDPFCSIQNAVVSAADGDTIRVMPGTYAECVNNLVATLGGPLKGLELVADAYVTSGDRTTTIIDGRVDMDTDGVLKCPDPADATVNLAGSPASPSLLKGFTITGGVASGVFAMGQVTITHNLITGNGAIVGGGIYLDGATCEYGDTTAVVRLNDVTHNTATGRAGGIFAITPSVSEIGCVGSQAEITIDSNLIDSNRNDDGPGGGLFVAAQTLVTELVHVTVTQNEITNNSIPAGATDGYGGGVYLATYGYGTENIEFFDNTVRSNQAQASGGGLSAYVGLVEQGNQTIVVDGNTLSDNSASGDGGGIDLFVVADGAGAGDSLGVQVTDNVVGPGNEAFGDLGGGGIVASFFSVRSPSTGMGVRIAGNDVVDNLARISGGGIALWSSADADLDSNGNTAPASAHIEVTGNRVVENDAAGGAGVGGGIFAYLEAIGDGEATVDLVLNTVRNNTAVFGAGGIEIDAFTEADANGSHAGQRAEVTIHSNVISENVGYGIGGPVSGGTTPLVRSIDYNDVFGNTSGGFQAPAVPGPWGIAEDPLLDAQDVPLACSPTIDAADPALDFSAEPPFNGGRANMGHTGGTALATPSFPDVNGDRLVDGFEVVELSAAFGAREGQDRFNAALNVDPAVDPTSGLQIVDGRDLAIIARDFAVSCP